MTYDTINDAVTMRAGLGAALGRIDQYELLRELGGGGFGTVYLARDTVSGVEYAVKGLPPMVRVAPEELERIRANFALVSRLGHTNIARAHVLHLAKEVCYADESARRKLRVQSGDTLMVMEYARGVTLSKWRRQFPGGKVPVEKALVIVRQVATALDYAHGQRILHRDIKPANVMVETKEDGSLVTRVLDFGLAAEIRSSMGHVSREIHDTSGTRQYMAPEQWVGARQGPAADQYALAALTCELVTGEVPFASVFETSDLMVMLNAVRGEPYAPPSDLPKAMRAALVRALSKDPGKRFASCTAFANALCGAGPQWRGPVISALVLLALGSVIYCMCGLDFGAGQRDKAQRLKNAAIELRERAQLAAEKRRLDAVKDRETAEKNTVPVPVAENEGEVGSFGNYCGTYKVKDGKTPVVVSTAWGVNPGRLIHARDIPNINDYRDTNELVSRMLAANDIREEHDIERGRITKIGTWGFSMGGGTSDDDEANHELDCGFPDYADGGFEIKRFLAMWKAYAQALARISEFCGEQIVISEQETGLDSVTNANATAFKRTKNEINSTASMRLAGVTFLAMAESLADGRYEVSVAMCLSNKQKEAYSSRETGTGACRGRYSIFEWLEHVSKIGMICPQAYCDKDGVWWHIAGVPVGLDRKRMKLEKSLVTAKKYAYEASLRTIDVQVSSERRLTSVMTETSGDGIRLEDRIKEKIKIDPMVAIPPLSITIMGKIDPLTGKPIRLVAAFLSEKDSRMLVPEHAGDGTSR